MSKNSEKDLIEDQLYKLPWILNDNPVAWLEITDLCNIVCGVCYRKHLTGHKDLKQIEDEILFLKKSRNPNNISIAGGEPLLHPQIVDIVSYTNKQGIKPLILTNGIGLTKDLLVRLKDVGLSGIVFHVDRMQKRLNVKWKTEVEFNSLRQQYADLVSDVEGLCTFFIATVYNENFREIPKVVEWASCNPRKVQGLIFVASRTIDISQDSATVGNLAVNTSELVYAKTEPTNSYLTTQDIYYEIKNTYPKFSACSYLGSTVITNTFKWTIGVVLSSKNGFLGSIGKASMELAQTFHRLFLGTYVLYGSLPIDKKGVYFFFNNLLKELFSENIYRLGHKIFILSLFDSKVREALKFYIKNIIPNPYKIFDDIYVQGIVIIQPPDRLPDGQFDACEGCPDMTVYKNELVNSCRMDEYRIFGGTINMNSEPS